MSRTKTFAEEFLELVPKAAEIHPLTWCVKRGMVPTMRIREFRCWECREFVLNEGACDPL